MRKRKSNIPIVKLINMHQAKMQLFQLIKLVEESDTLVRICRNGRAVVELRRVNTAKNPLKQHKGISGVRFAENPLAPVSEEDWPKF